MEADGKGERLFRVPVYHARGCPRNRNALLSIWVGKHVDPYSGRHPSRGEELGHQEEDLARAWPRENPCVASRESWPATDIESNRSCDFFSLSSFFVRRESALENFLPSVVFLSLTKSREDSVEKSFNLSLIELFGKKILSIFRSLFPVDGYRMDKWCFFSFFFFSFQRIRFGKFFTFVFF